MKDQFKMKHTFDPDKVVGEIESYHHSNIGITTCSKLKVLYHTMDKCNSKQRRNNLGVAHKCIMI